MVDAVGARGGDAQALLREAAISPELVLIPQARASASQYSALWRLVIRELDDEFFSQDSRRMKTGSFALLCLSVVHCTGLRAALERNARFLGAFLDDITIDITTQSGRVRICLERRSTGRVPTVFANEPLLVMITGRAAGSSGAASRS